MQHDQQLGEAVGSRKQTEERSAPQVDGSFRFETWRKSINVKDKEYEGPLPREDSLGALQAENPHWTGKLTVQAVNSGLC
ncbi:hypothetical protein WJX74_001157 [Apatococcus lobatus]|uniref:Uncharacterized protein n=1 Tax=Apatococcus lobatus TaxID=904363 RepID=A0AAW1S5D8_9CHLO